MKLATRYQRINLIVMLAIFGFASGAFYVLMHRVLIFQVDEDLEIEQHEILNYAARFGTLPVNVMPVEDQMVTFEPVAAPLERPVHRTVVMQDQVEREVSHFRQLLFTVRAGGKWYKVAVSKSLESTEGLAHAIGLIALATIALLLLASFLINRMVLRRLWQPFYNTIDRLRGFRLDSKEKLTWPGVSIEEFALLNKTLEATTARAASDFGVLKEFTENAAHELQTPLAILRSKLDLLIQDEVLSEIQSTVIQDAYSAVRRMSYLNQSLLTLAKIEGGQFAEKSAVALNALVQEKLASFETFIQEKQLQMDVVLEDITLQINPALADILLNNLCANAILHNHEGGKIAIRLSESGLAVCNTSPNEALASENLFTRFCKTTSGATRTGLGLAIVRQVCEANGHSVTYTYEEDGLHCFRVGWSAESVL